MTKDEVELKRFLSSSINSGQSNAIQIVDIMHHDLAKKMLEVVPDSADRSAALRYLRLAQMQFNSAIIFENQK